MPLVVTCIIPPGRLTVPSDPTLPFGAPPALIVSGCHTPRHAVLVQIHFPFCSPESRYNVKPFASTKIVVPRVELDAVFTTDAEEPALVVGAAAALDAVELLELLPHAASSTDAASVGTNSLVI
jgi:hypothetical protein